MGGAAGYNWYQDDEMSHKYFDVFVKEYEIDSIFRGLYHKVRTEEER